jgi:hypothetical protein
LEKQHGRSALRRDERILVRFPSLRGRSRGPRVTLLSPAFFPCCCLPSRRERKERSSLSLSLSPLPPCDGRKKERREREGKKERGALPLVVALFSKKRAREEKRRKVKREAEEKNQQNSRLSFRSRN